MNLDLHVQPLPQAPSKSNSPFSAQPSRAKFRSKLYLLSSLTDLRAGEPPATHNHKSFFLSSPHIHHDLKPPNPIREPLQSTSPFNSQFPGHPFPPVISYEELGLAPFRLLIQPQSLFCRALFACFLNKPRSF
ncbi:hypothetical protein LX36DRAFT_427457 [Colletotrichum falcatum]|nr:hypothetical protein LX36DRAFT_427457 [Colletotrichum falcatum]